MGSWLAKLLGREEAGKVELAGDAGPQAEGRSLVGFDQLQVDGAVDVRFRRGESFSVVVHADYAEDVKKVRTEVRGQKLIVSCEDLQGRSNSVRLSLRGSLTIVGDGNVVGRRNVVQGDLVAGGVSFRGPVVVQVTAPSLVGVLVRGSSDVVLEGLQEDVLGLQVEGSGSIRAQGSAVELRAKVLGSGDIEAKQLEALRVFAAVMGSGDVTCRARASVDASIGGSGDIFIYGKPDTRKERVSGSGSLWYRRDDE